MHNRLFVAIIALVVVGLGGTMWCVTDCQDPTATPTQTWYDNLPTPTPSWTMITATWIMPATSTPRVRTPMPTATNIVAPTATATRPVIGLPTFGAPSEQE